MTKRHATKKSAKTASAKKTTKKNRAMPAKMAGHVKHSGPVNGRGDDRVSVEPSRVPARITQATVSPAVQPFLPSALTSVPANYAAQLLAIANANVRVALEFSQRLARIRSPLEFFAVAAEFSRRRMQMLPEQLASLLPKSG